MRLKRAAHIVVLTVAAFTGIWSQEVKSTAYSESEIGTEAEIGQTDGQTGRRVFSCRRKDILGKFSGRLCIRHMEKGIQLSDRSGLELYREQLQWENTLFYGGLFTDGLCNLAEAVGIGEAFSS